MVDLLDDIQTRGLSALRDIVAENREETLHLEFKTLSDQSGTSVTKDDRRTIARAICGMSNAEGGLLLVGIETKTVDQVDVGVDLRPVADIDAFRNRIVGWLPDCLSPQHVTISVHVIQDAGSRGYLAIQIPASDLRPHMSNVHHQYFRRGSSGTRVMEHGEVRDLMLAPREGVLRLGYRFAHSMTAPQHRYKFDFILSLENAGKVAVRAPYMKVVGDARCQRFADVHTLRRHPDGAVGIYLNRDMLIHVDDQISVGKIPSGLQISGYDDVPIAKLLTIIGGRETTPNFRVGHSPNSATDELINIEVSYGAENAKTVVERIALNKADMIDLMSKALSKQ